jgi:putative ribosome biogenesis GTPase RsgA
LPRLERYLALVQTSSAAPIIVLNKSDFTNGVIGTAGQIAFFNTIGQNLKFNPKGVVASKTSLRVGRIGVAR